MVVKVDKTKHIDFDSEGFYFTNEFKFHDVWTVMALQYVTALH